MLLRAQGAALHDRQPLNPCTSQDSRTAPLFRLFQV